MAKLTRPSLSMLPLSDLKRYIEDIILPTATLGKIGNMEAEDIAANARNSEEDIYEEMDEETKKMHTVNNALRLNGKKAEEYAEIKDISKIHESMRGLTDIRDELYQLKASMVKSNITEDTTGYMGFFDAFNMNTIKYENWEIQATREDQEIMINTDDKEKLEPYINKYIAFHVEGVDPEITELRNIILARQEEPRYSLDLKNKKVHESFASSIIKPYAGRYHRGRYSFSSGGESFASSSRISEGYLSTENALVINNNMKGAGQKLKIIKESEGLLDYIGIRVHSESHTITDKLNCFILKEQDVEEGMDIEEIKSAAKAVSVSLKNTSNQIGAGKNNIFWFDSFMDKETDRPYIITEGSYYFFVILSDIVSSETEIILSAGEQSENYQISSNGTIRKENSPKIFFQTYTRPKVSDVERYYKTGLYTTVYKLPKSRKSNKVRITLRPDRGVYFIVDTASPETTSEKIRIVHQNGFKSPSFEGSHYLASYAGKEIIINESIRTLKADGELSSPIDIDQFEESIVMFKNYEVLILPFKQSGGERIYKETPIKATMEEFILDSNTSRNPGRIIFEADMGEELYDGAIIQIVYNRLDSDITTIAEIQDINAVFSIEDREMLNITPDIWEDDEDPEEDNNEEEDDGEGEEDNNEEEEGDGDE